MPELDQIAQLFDPSSTVPILNCLANHSTPTLLTIYFADNAAWALNIASPLYETLLSIGKQDNISLFLRSQGGQIEAPWKIICLLREFCSTLMVLIPDYAMSGATHISIAADTLVMGELSCIGSVDPSRKHPRGPKDDKNALIPISVQDVIECMNFVREQLGKNHRRSDLVPVITELFKYVDPLAIGAVQQSYNLGKLITEKALRTRQCPPSEKEISEIVDRLAGKYFSHHYPISREEAKNDLARLYRGEGITAVICSLCRISASLTNSVHKPICATVSRRAGKRNVGQSCMT